ncbi:CG4433 [Drosophila busckii]|uniref:N-acetylglucosaminyl-phosphatidylinositol de-N-acetylase n=1 Tax=Drosophila busckii TaxID=30019 RepID=A0A0M4EG71_DROBS|nr:N-acetylglucosaminyl-phosphatidylinositol de-N-acetylase [Drosophila busckii]ALC47316.1 CG4433 [Drosophila busckii]
MRFNWLSDYLATIVNTSAFFEASTRHLAGLHQQLAPRNIYCNIKSTSAEALEHILIACGVYFLICLGLYKLTFWLSATGAGATTGGASAPMLGSNNNKASGDTASSGLRRTLQNGLHLRSVHLPRAAISGRVLLVTAHPDDECMFFGPLIYSLVQRADCQVYVLCLSNGNFEQQAQLRREELFRACKRLGVVESNVILVNATNLPDDPNVEWRPDAVAGLILHTVESLDIQAIFTFDRDGVSSHPNHCAVYYAAASLCLANLLPKACKFYTLDSINLARKYLSVFDLLCTCFMSTHWCILSWKEAAIVRGAMLEHQSQMKWFRWLYIYTSRYMYINSMREVNLSDIELEMQIHDH